MKKATKIFAILLVCLVTLTGCTKTMKDSDNKTVINEQTGQSLTSNILCLPTKEYFGGWYLDEALTEKVDLSTYKVTSDVTLYAKWTDEKVEESSTTEEETTTEETVEEETTTTTKASKKNTTTKTTTTTETTTTSSDKTYTVKFETNGHGDVETQTVKENELISEPNLDKTLYEQYEENEENMDIKLSDLRSCETMKIYEKKTYNGLWVAIFVRPLAWVIIKIGKLIGNYGLSVMLVGLLIRIIILPLSAKTSKQQENMKKAQPAIERIEKKYAGKNDQDSMMQKSQETMAVYQQYKINPMSSCLVSLIQLPLFFAFLEAINRVPAIFENSFWKFQLGTTPLVGIKAGNYWYLLLIILILLFTVLSFRTSMSSMSGSSEQQKQTKYMLIFMTIFIGIASIQLPAAIALYWVVTNAFNVVQMYIFKKVGSKHE